jgi:hypothetical protein
MDRRLHLLDSFAARGPDGTTHRVFAYEHLVRTECLPTSTLDEWASSGQIEYRLEDGTRVVPGDHGSFAVAGVH